MNLVGTRNRKYFLIYSQLCPVLRSISRESWIFHRVFLETLFWKSVDSRTQIIWIIMRLLFEEFTSTELSKNMPEIFSITYIYFKPQFDIEFLDENRTTLFSNALLSYFSVFLNAKFISLVNLENIKSYKFNLYFIIRETRSVSGMIEYKFCSIVVDIK